MSREDRQLIRTLYDREHNSNPALPEHHAIWILGVTIRGTNDATIDMAIGNLKLMIAKGEDLIKELLALQMEQKKQSPAGQRIGRMLEALGSFLQESGIPVPEFDLVAFVDAETAFNPAVGTFQSNTFIEVQLDTNSHGAQKMWFYAMSEGWRIDIMGRTSQLLDLSVAAQQRIRSVA